MTPKTNAQATRHELASTPAPWTLWKERTTALCDVHPGPNRDSDARLIAAAPEMLELLKEISAGDVAPGCTQREQRFRALLARIDGKEGTS